MRPCWRPHNIEPRTRTLTSAFADSGLVDALRSSGGRILVLAGVASEIVVPRTALCTCCCAYVVHVAVDACGSIDSRTEEAAWRRICGAGGTTTSAITFAAELTGDFLGRATLGIAYEMLGA